MSDLPDDTPPDDDVPTGEVPDVEEPGPESAHDDGEHDDVAPEPTPTLADLLALLGLPTDARALVVTPETVVAIAADYPEPYTPPAEEA